MRVLDNSVSLTKLQLVILMDPEELMNSKGVLGRNRTKEKRYAFDFAFDKESG